MSRFQPYADRPTLSMNYYETPAEVLEDSDQLIVWARRSLSIAAASPPKPKKKAKAKAAKAPKAKRAFPRAPVPKKQPKRVTRKSR
jgi:TfoX/Sxy family transcriptional regulator of competence genes